MQFTDSNNIDQYLDYLFGKLSHDQEAELESYWESHPDEAELLDDLSAYIHQKNIADKEQFYQTIGQSQAQTMELWELGKSSPPGDTKKKWIGEKPLIITSLASLILLGLLLWIWFNRPQEEILKDLKFFSPPEEEELFEKFEDRASKDLEIAGSGLDTWRVALGDSKSRRNLDSLLMARNLLEKVIERGQAEELEYYYAGLLQLLVPEGSPTKAVEYLESSRGLFTKPEAGQIDKFLIIAHLQIGNTENLQEAKRLLAKNPAYKEELSKEVIQQLQD